MDMPQAEKDEHHFRCFNENITGQCIKADVNPNTPTPHPNGTGRYPLGKKYTLFWLI
jgi:hypothetical protein